MFCVQHHGALCQRQLASKHFPAQTSHHLALKAIGTSQLIYIEATYKVALVTAIVSPRHYQKKTTFSQLPLESIWYMYPAAFLVTLSACQFAGGKSVPYHVPSIVVITRQRGQEQGGSSMILLCLIRISLDVGSVNFIIANTCTWND